MVDISVVVAVYKDANALELILNSLEKQTYTNFEIIIAEDCESTEIQECIDKYEYMNLKHTTQKDLGWRKNASLNNAIRIAQGKLIVFIDGDCVPNLNFVKEYSRLKANSTVLCGRRIELGNSISSNIRQEKETFFKLEKNYLFHYISLIKDNTRHYEEGIYLNDFFYNLKHKNKESGILGCNFGVNKEDLVAINGFNENYNTASCGEDTDIEYRLKLKGCKFKRMRNKAFVFHLYHKNTYSSKDHELSMLIFNDIKDKQEAICKNGLSKLSN